MNKKFAPFEVIMKEEKMPQIAIDTFRLHYETLLREKDNFIYESSIEPAANLKHLDTISSQTAADSNLTDRTIIIKLNGGLGTTMGMEQAKSLIKAKNGLSFLEIILKQAKGSQQQILLMDSFATYSDSRPQIKKICEEIEIEIPETFIQHKVPKVMKDSLEPAKYSQNPELEWAPPGHGDIYTALITSGILKKLLGQGKKYAFVSNADNLGATMEPAIAAYMDKNSIPFLMEVCQRADEDRKGGHLALNRDGKLILRELAQCHPDELDFFQDIDRHCYFNTNSIWINLENLMEIMERCGNILHLPLIRNEKNLNPRDTSSPKVYQLETAMGCAISLFDNAQALIVGRERFRPIKSTNDLVLFHSDRYRLNEKFKIENTAANRKLPVINLDGTFFRTIDQMEQRFPEGIPSLKDCRSLKVIGDVVFGKNIKIKNDAVIKNTSAKQVKLGDNIEIEGELTLK